MSDPTETTLMNALSTLSSSQLSSLCSSLSAAFHHHRCRLVSLLSSPALFSHTLDYLYSLPLSQKSLLIARHLLHLLRHLHHHLSPTTTTPATARLRDLDSVLLLLLFCEVRHRDPKALETPTENWRGILAAACSGNSLKLAAAPLMASPAEVLGAFVEKAAKLKRFVGSKGCGSGSSGGGEVAAAAEVVVSLPSVVVEDGRGCECVICKEEMGGRDVCQLLCQHVFHWICVLPWLRKRNTCPCCRFQLPTDDVYGEIQRLWEIIAKAGSTNNHQFGVDQCT